MSEKPTQEELLENLDELVNYGRLRISHSEQSTKRLMATIDQLKEIVEEHETQKNQLAAIQALFQEMKQQKPTVSREKITKLIAMIYLSNTELEGELSAQRWLKDELGVEVEK